MLENIISTKKHKIHHNSHSDNLRLLPCLSYLQDNELAEIGQKSLVKKYFKDDLLFLTSEKASFLFILETGSINLYKKSNDGRVLGIKVMEPGDYFCCAPILTDNKNIVSAVAAEDTTVLAIPAEDFKKMLCKNSTYLGMKTLQSICSRIRNLSNIIESMAFNNVEKRVLMVLLDISERQAEDGSDTAFLKLTHEDIASLTGTVREVVARIMVKFRKLGIVLNSKKKGKLLINICAAKEHLGSVKYG